MEMTTETKTATEWKDGDVFRWRYNPDREKQIRERHGDPYWAKSLIGVVRSGQLFDTYWSSFDANTIRWTPGEAHELELLYLGNFADWDRRDEWQAEYYDEADCVNLNHPNSSKGNFYIRKGAQRSRARMLEVAKYKLERAEETVRSAQRDVERMRGLIFHLENGGTVEGMYL